jgi:hypothetical protein
LFPFDKQHMVHFPLLYTQFFSHKYVTFVHVVHGLWIAMGQIFVDGNCSCIVIQI